MLVANKIDQYGDRMVLVEDGQRRYREIGCVGFREISVRESIEQVKSIIFDVHSTSHSNTIIRAKRVTFCCCCWSKQFDIVLCRLNSMPF